MKILLIKGLIIKENINLEFNNTFERNHIILQTLVSAIDLYELDTSL
jgi:hypothetical protein